MVSFNVPQLRTEWRNNSKVHSCTQPIYRYAPHVRPGQANIILSQHVPKEVAVGTRNYAQP